jgi:hypothetical protein
MRGRRSRVIPIGIAVLIGLVWVLRVPLVNLLGVIDDRGYIIPKESSWFTFRILKMNEGSGEWWIYGEDERNYYFQGDHEYKIGYVVFPKTKVNQCRDFNKLEYATWCKKYVLHSN